MGRLDGKVAITTGAASGIGQAVAVAFAKEGAKVAVVDRNIEAGEETVRIIKKGGGQAIFVEADVSRSQDVKKMIETTVNNYGKLDILFNNAGFIAEVAPTADAGEEAFDATIATNLKGVFLGMKYAIPEMLKKGGGSIINTAALSGEMATPCTPAYSASKGGVLALSRGTAVEYAAKNIRVNCITPGPIATPALAALLKDNLETKRNYLAAVPQGRLGSTTEVAQAVVFLASDESSYVTGHSLAVDGGLRINSGLRPV